MQFAQYAKYLSTALLSTPLAAVAQPGNIFLSGDSSILYAILPGGFGPFPNDNDTFFRNVLEDGDEIRISFGSLPEPGDDLVNDYYNSLAGVNSETIDDDISSQSLLGVDLLFVALPSQSLTTQEIASLSDYLADGGNLFFVGEHGNFDISANNRINDALLNLGSSLRIESTFDDSGERVATRASGQIIENQFTTGVDSFVYGGQAISAVNGGQTLFLQSDGQTPFLSVQQIPSPATAALFGVVCVINSRRRRTDSI